MLKSTFDWMPPPEPTKKPAAGKVAFINARHFINVRVDKKTSQIKDARVACPVTKKTAGVKLAEYPNDENGSICMGCGLDISDSMSSQRKRHKVVSAPGKELHFKKTRGNEMFQPSPI